MPELEALLETDDEELEEDEAWKRMTKSWKKRGNQICMDV